MSHTPRQPSDRDVLIAWLTAKSPFRYAAWETFTTAQLRQSARAIGYRRQASGPTCTPGGTEA